MSKQQNTAAALAGILRAKRSDNGAAAPASPAAPPVEVEAPPPPSPALPSPSLAAAAPRPETRASEGRGGKSSDPNYRQYTVYLRKATRKKVSRALDDVEDGPDFSDLVETLLQQWLVSRT